MSARTRWKRAASLAGRSAIGAGGGLSAGLALGTALGRALGKGRSLVAIGRLASLSTRAMRGSRCAFSRARCLWSSSMLYWCIGFPLLPTSGGGSVLPASWYSLIQFPQTVSLFRFRGRCARREREGQSTHREAAESSISGPGGFRGGGFGAGGFRGRPRDGTRACESRCVLRVSRSLLTHLPRSQKSEMVSGNCIRGEGQARSTHRTPDPGHRGER